MDFSRFCEELSCITESYQKELFTELKKHSKPIIIFGAGEVAKRVLLLLNSQNIIPDYQMVDEEYEASTIYEIKPIRMEMAKKIFPNGYAQIVAGMRDYPHVEKISKKLGYNVYYLDKIFQTEGIDHDYFQSIATISYG